MQSELLFIQEVSEEFRIPVPTLRWWIATGRGGPRSGKLGKRIVYKRADVEAFVELGFA